MTKVIIVGGVAGGASAAARLRRLDENMEIIVIEKGDFISFANCGLPYYISGIIADEEDLILQTPESFNQRFNVDVRILHEVIAIQPQAKAITVKDLSDKSEYSENYDYLILSPGAAPIRPPLAGFDLPRVFTIRNIPDTLNIKKYIEQFKPKKVAIIGGGFIGLEMVENLHLANIDISLIEMSNQVLAPLDYDMAADVHNYLIAKGVKLFLNNAVESIIEENNTLLINLVNEQIEVDFVILAIGVSAESHLAKIADLELNERGGIVVDEHMLTSDSFIYSIGDACEVTDFVTQNKTMIPLAGPANKQGRIVADNIKKEDSIYQGTQGSAIVKIFDMSVATTGINEKSAKKNNIDYEKSYIYSASHASYYPGASNMSIKTIFEKGSGKILGVQIVGFDGCDKRSDVLATAIHFHATAKDLTKLELCYAPPFSSAKDPVNMIGYVIENIINEKVKIFHWHDVVDLVNNKNVVILDVRSNDEYKQGYIANSLNIPLPKIRVNSDQIEKNKPLYIYCHSGLRGYLACRILVQKGYDCYNLSGGYRLYNSIYPNQN